MAGTLYIVGTPIGNLKDITYRAVETLKSVDIIACEDTRHSRTLLDAYGISAPLVSYYKQKEREGSEQLVKKLLDGKNVALITDAGMPAISDPGAILVSEARNSGVTVTVVPGPTAVASAMALSGYLGGGFTFLGFLPEKRKDKVAVLSEQKNNPLALVFYVSPHDLYSQAEFLCSELGDRKVWAVKEITKMFERVTETTLGAFDVGEAKGEYVIIVEGATKEKDFSGLSISEHVKNLMDGGLSKKDAIKKVATDRNLPKNDVYQQALDL